MSCFRPLRHKEWIFSKKLEMKKSHACVPLNLGVLKIYRGPVYYHERKESINPQLLKKSPNLPAWGAPKSILLGNFGRALINPPRQLLAHPYQSVRQQTTTICTLPVPLHIAWGSLSLFVGTADPPSPLRPRPKRPTYPSTPLGYGGLGVRPLASVWTFGDHPGSQTEVRIKQDFTSLPASSWLWRKLHQKVQLFQREGGGMLYWPACRVAYKRKSWRAWFSVCSQRCTPPHPSLTQPKLYHLDTVC
jgi:hypothetical protein